MQTFEAQFTKHEFGFSRSMEKNHNLQPNPMRIPGPGPPPPLALSSMHILQAVWNHLLLWLTRIRWSIHPSPDQLRTHEFIKKISLSQQGRSIPYYCFHEKNPGRKLRPETVSVELFFETGGHGGGPGVHRPQTGAMERRRRAVSPLPPVLVGRGWWVEWGHFDRDIDADLIAF